MRLIELGRVIQGKWWRIMPLLYKIMKGNSDFRTIHQWENVISL